MDRTEREQLPPVVIAQLRIGRRSHSRLPRFGAFLADRVAAFGFAHPRDYDLLPKKGRAAPAGCRCGAAGQVHQDECCDRIDRGLGLADAHGHRQNVSSGQSRRGGKRVEISRRSQIYQHVVDDLLQLGPAQPAAIVRYEARFIHEQTLPSGAWPRRVADRSWVSRLECPPGRVRTIALICPAA